MKFKLIYIATNIMLPGIGNFLNGQKKIGILFYIFSLIILSIIGRLSTNYEYSFYLLMAFLLFIILNLSSILLLFKSRVPLSYTYRNQLFLTIAFFLIYQGVLGFVIGEKEFELISDLKLSYPISESMTPNLIPHKTIVFSYPFHKREEIKRGDIVRITTSFSKKEKLTLIKRIIGIPGDLIEYKDNNLILNGKVVTKTPIKLSNLSPSEKEKYKSYFDKPIFKQTLDKNHFLIIDSNSLNTENFIKIVPDGEYFVLGDNRDKSLDSRNDNFGTIREEDITGFGVFYFDNLTSFRALKGSLY